jgi:hypothetical protein
MTVVAKDSTFTPSRIVVDEGDLVKITTSRASSTRRAPTGS